MCSEGSNQSIEENSQEIVEEPAAVVIINIIADSATRSINDAIVIMMIIDIMKFEFGLSGR